MRKIYLLTALIITVFSLQTVFGQKTARRTIEVLPKQNAKIELINASASTDGNGGALLEWETGGDKKSIGFNVYRVENGGKISINSSLIIGSAFGNAGTRAGNNNFGFFDASGVLGSAYLLEIVDVDGASTFSESFSANYDSNVRGRISEASNYSELNEIGAPSQLEYPAPLADKFQEGNIAAAPSDVAEKQRWVAAQPGAKIGITKEGLYRVTKAQLAAGSLNLNSPVANWQLYTDGIEQPILVTGVMPDGRLGDNGYIEFYARTIDITWSGTKIYYLVAGNAPGKRIVLNTRSLNPSKVAPQNFSLIVERKDRVNYTALPLNGDAENHYGGVIVAQSSGNLGVSVTLDIRGIDTTAAPATIKVSTQGLTPSSHRICAIVNPTLTTDPTCSEGVTFEGSGRVAMQHQFTVPVSRLNEGINTIRFFSMNSISGGAQDNNLFDFARITYTRRFQANNNALTFTTAQARATSVKGFTTKNIRVFDITDPNNTSRVGAEILNNAGAFEVFIPSNRPRILAAVGEGAQLTNASITANAPSNALTTALNKDLVIITHADFLTAANNLAAYRRTQGLTVEVVNVEDALDESGYGVFSPYSIKAFLQAVNPRYALMYGDANYNPRRYPLTFGGAAPAFRNFVPAKMYDTIFGEAASDEFLGDFDNDEIAEFPIGRITAHDAATAQTIVDKIISYEQNVNVALMNRGAVTVCDLPDGYDFCGSIQTVRNRLPANMPTAAIRREDDPDPVVIRQRIINEINNGRFLVMYSGHGSSATWTSAQILRSVDVPSMTNINNLNIFFPLNCLNGAFTNENSDSLGELMVKSPIGGSVAGWSSSGDTFPDSQELMALRLFQGIGNGEFTRLGDALRTAKFATSDPDVRASWVLLGDPTLKIK